MREDCVGDTVSRHAEDRKGVEDVVPIYAVNGVIGWNEIAQATECGTNAFGSETPGGMY